MNIHEYQAKQLLAKYNVTTPTGYPAFSVDEAVAAAKKLEKNGNKVFVVKAQIHAGGRGKAGGVKVVKTIDVLNAAEYTAILNEASVAGGEGGYRERGSVPQRGECDAAGAEAPRAALGGGGPDVGRPAPAEADGERGGGDTGLPRPGAQAFGRDGG